MRCDELKDLIPLHALDLLEPAERASVREHLDAGCPRCAAEMAAFAETVGRLPYALPAEEPSPMAKARLMAAVRNEPAAAPPAPASWRPAAASVAAALIAGLLAGGAALLWQRQVVAGFERRNAELAAQVERQREELTALARRVEAARRSVQLVSAPGVRVIDLAGAGERAGQSARVFWDPARRAWQLYASSLPAAPAGRTYQLWVITDAGRKISAGTFENPVETAAEGSVTIPSDAGRAVVAAITEEPAGGSEQPTAQPFLVGSVGP